MSGLLILLALIAAVLFVSVRVFRRRAQLNLERAGHQLPPEIAAFRAARSASATATALPMPLSAPAPAMKGAPHFMLIYEVGPDFVQRRAQYREEHLALAWKAADSGQLVLAGALEEPTEQAFLLFRGSREAAGRFAQADPYVRHGLVRKWQVKQWYTVAGAAAATPQRPKL